ncbi:hypothetical protein PAMP_002376 [Pampus punctatissimus]
MIEMKFNNLILFPYVPLFTNTGHYIEKDVKGQKRRKLGEMRGEHYRRAKKLDIKLQQKEKSSTLKS